jgi:hypothetical protein
MGRPKEKSPQTEERSPASQITNIQQTLVDAQNQREMSSIGILSSYDVPPYRQTGNQQVERSADTNKSPWTSNGYTTGLELSPGRLNTSKIEDNNALSAPELENLLSAVILPQSPSVSGFQDVYPGVPFQPRNYGIQDMETCIHRLSELQVSLCRCSRAVSAITLTPRSGQIPPQAVNNSCLSSPYGIQTGQDPPSVELQSLFHSSQILLDIISVPVRILRD